LETGGRGGKGIFFVEEALSSKIGIGLSAQN